MENQRGFFSVIPAFVMEDEHLVDKAKLLYGEIAALTQREGFCWAKNERFAARFRVTKRAVSKWVTQLQRRGHIRVEILDGHDRQIWITHPINAPPPTNKRSRGVEPVFVGGGTTVPPPYSDKNNEKNKENTYSKSPRAEGSRNSGHHPQREAFIALWSAAYEDFFGVSYKVQNGKDGKAADGLLTLKGASPEQLIEIARKSWSRKDGFNCKHAVSLSGFASRFNEIRAELGLLHKSTRTRGF